MNDTSTVTERYCDRLFRQKLVRGDAPLRRRLLRSIFGTILVSLVSSMTFLIVTGVWPSAPKHAAGTSLSRARLVANQELGLPVGTITPQYLPVPGVSDIVPHLSSALANSLRSPLVVGLEIFEEIVQTHSAVTVETLSSHGHLKLGNSISISSESGIVVTANDGSWRMALVQDAAGRSGLLVLYGPCVFETPPPTNESQTSAGSCPTIDISIPDVTRPTSSSFYRGTERVYRHELIGREG